MIQYVGLFKGHSTNQDHEECCSAGESSFMCSVALKVWKKTSVVFLEHKDDKKIVETRLAAVVSVTGVMRRLGRHRFCYFSTTPAIVMQLKNKQTNI